MDLFKSEDYKDYIRYWISTRPKNGRGELKRLAAEIGAHTTYLSHVFNGNKDLSAEQAYDLARTIGLNQIETDYFMNLVQWQRAGNYRLKEHYYEKMLAIREDSQKISKRIEKERVLSEVEQLTFYSKWPYSAARLVTAIDSINTIEDISNALNLPRPLVSTVVDFLVKTKLCVYRDGNLSYGPHSTHIASDSPMVTRHHTNWRLKAIDSFENLGPDELAYTSPAIIERKHAEEIRDILLDAITRFTEKTDSSGCEELYCLNMDWFRVTK